MITRRFITVMCGLLACLQASCTPAPELSPELAPELPPNVVMIIVDDLNTNLGSYGHPQVQTPHIDQLANQGVLFTNAYTQYPQCNQSRASLLTGLYPDQTGVLSLKDNFRDIVPDVVTLPQHFRNNGYLTARVGKVFHQGVPTEIGTDGMDDPLAWDVKINPSGIDREIEDQIVSIVPPAEDRRRFGAILSWLSVDGDRKHTDQLGTDAAIELLEKHHPDKTGKPLFLALGLYRPHTPFVAPAPYFDLYPLEQIKPVAVPANDRDNKPVAALADRKYQADMTDLQKRQAIQGYYASISFVDSQLGRLTRSLDELGLGENTLILFVSDHGYQLGLHGLWQKRDLYENTLRTPMIISAPGQLQEGLKTSTLAELVDIYPTLVSLAGLESPAGKLEGKDLLAILNGQEPEREAALSQSWSAAYLTRPEWRGKDIMGYSIRTENYRYTEWGGGEYGSELYDYRADSSELDNLADKPGYEVVTHKMKSLLGSKLRSISNSE